MAAAWSFNSTRHLSLIQFLAAVCVLLVGIASPLFNASLTTPDCPDNCLCSLSTGHVTCDGGGFKSFPVFASGLPVTTLDLSRNFIRYLKASIFSVGVDSDPLDEVVELKMCQNGLESIDRDVFSDQPLANRLQILDLSENALSELNPGVFSPLKHLVHLNLAVNRLSSIDGALNDLIDLVRLDLRANRLTALGTSTFAGLSSLRYLRLDDNSISLIDRKTFEPLQRLAYLAMKANPFGASTNVLFNFSSTFLSYIDMSECQLDHIPRELPLSLRYLQLRRNRIRRLDIRSLAGWSANLNILVLDENELEDIKDGSLAVATELQQIWLNGNLLPAIPRPLPGELQKLFMDSNRVGKITDDDFSSSSATSVLQRDVPHHDGRRAGSQLSVISLLSNNISTISPGAFSKLHQLSKLDLSGNCIRRLPTGTFSASNSRLRTLTLSNNPIDTIDSRAFDGLTSLEMLSLSYISTPNMSLADDAFAADFPSLHRLDLNSSPSLIRGLLVEPASGARRFAAVRDLAAFDSELETLPVDFFATQFPELSVLQLSSTRWRCDQQLIWLRNWLLSETTVHIDQPNENFRCWSPPEVADYPVTSLDESEFAPSTQLVPSAGMFRPLSPPSQSSALPNLSSQSRGTILPISISNTVGPVDRLSSTASDSVPSWEHILSRVLAATTSLSHASREDNRLVRGHHENITRRRIVMGTQTELANVELGMVSVSTYVEYSDGANENVATRGLVIALVTVFATILIIALLLTIIVYMCRKQQQQQPATDPKKCYVSSSLAQPSTTNGPFGLSSYGSTSETNGRTKQQHVQWIDQSTNDAVYFMTANGSCTPLVTPTTCGCNGQVRTAVVEQRRPSLITTTLSDDYVTTVAVAPPKQIPLVSGHALKHEGPLCVYKWEDF